MRPGADRYTPDDTADPPTSSAGSGFAEAYRVHRPGLVKLAAFIVGDQATGEDVVQDVFTRLHQRWDMLADPGEPLPYLRTAVVNGCRSAIRRRGRAQRHAGDDSPSPPLSAEEAVLLSEDRQQVLAALARLSRRRREGAGAPVLRRIVGGGDSRHARHQRRDRQVHRGPRARGPRSRAEGDPMISQEEMNATADRLTDTLTAAAAIMPPDEAHALSRPAPAGPRRRLQHRSGAGWAACACGWFPSASRPSSPRSS